VWKSLRDWWSPQKTIPVKKKGKGWGGGWWVVGGGGGVGWCGGGGGGGGGWGVLGGWVFFFFLGLLWVFFISSSCSCPHRPFCLSRKLRAGSPRKKSPWKQRLRRHSSKSGKAVGLNLFKSFGSRQSTIYEYSRARKAGAKHAQAQKGAQIEAWGGWDHLSRLTFLMKPYREGGFNGEL